MASESGGHTANIHIMGAHYAGGYCYALPD